MDGNFRDEVYRKLGSRLVDYGIAVQMIQDDGEEPVLHCAFQPADSDRAPMLMEVSFYQLDDVNILQFYIYLTEQTPKEKMDSMRQVLDDCSCFLPVGHIGFYGEEHQMYFKYSLLLGENDKPDDATEKSLTAIELISTELSADLDQIFPGEAN